MKLLWITNVLFPDICNVLNIKAPVTGGWLSSSAKAILNLDQSIELAVATLYGNEFRKDLINGITYYCLPFNIYKQRKYCCDLEKYWKRVANDFKPQIVHIHGTEFPHGLAYIKTMGANNVVISIQGLISVCARYCLGQIPIPTLNKYQTIYDIFKGHLTKLPRQMNKSGLIEKEYIRISKHFIGRTDWDRVHLWAINPNIKYHFCNETLRDSFYKMKWDLNKCEKYSIFLSQAYNPIKGIHKVIEALPYVIREFPNVKVYVAGSNFTQKRSLKDKLRFGTYGNYVLHLMKSLGVEKHFTFMGLLDENLMAERYQKSHIFICPSSIENSPNSLCEAQLVGTPTIASYVGGIPNMIENGKSGLLYRFEEHEMLANCICTIFKNDKLANELSEQERYIANIRHNKRENAQRTIEIYNSILK